MNRDEKIKELLNTLEVPEKDEHIINFIIEGKPENYVRERSGRGNHFYNPKSNKMQSYKLSFLKMMSKDSYNYTRELIKNLEANYFIELKADYYLPIPKADSIKVSALKEKKIIRPIIRPDLDNYDKFLIDSLHNVVFEDDKRVVSISSNKYYSLNPRTEIEIIITEYKD